MVDAVIGSPPQEARGMTELPGRAVTDAAAPTIPAEDRWIGAGEDRSWDAAMSEGWRSSPPVHRSR